MTKSEFSYLLDRVIGERTEMSYVFTSSGYVYLYSDDNTFTATFICRVIDIAREYFIGVKVDLDNRPYLLFTL